jgi:hypothetical protein
MQIANVYLSKFVFPGTGGELQQNGGTAELVRELGGNYARYHEFLRQEIDLADRFPERNNYDSMDSYLEAWAHLQDLVKAEALLRNCRAHLMHGRALDAAIDPTLSPLVDNDRRLLSAQ